MNAIPSSVEQPDIETYVFYPRTKEESEVLAYWLYKRIPNMSMFVNFVCFALTINDKIAGVVLWHQFRKDKRCVSKRIVKAILRFPFEVLNMKRVIALVSIKNKKSIKALKQLGFIVEGRLREAYDDGSNALLFAMLKSDFEKGKYYG